SADCARPATRNPKEGNAGTKFLPRAPPLRRASAAVMSSIRTLAALPRRTVAVIATAGERRRRKTPTARNQSGTRASTRIARRFGDATRVESTCLLAHECEQRTGIGLT